ncbi:glutamate-rich protein 6B isoform 1-T2 [Vipera latastei]
MLSGWKDLLAPPPRWNGPSLPSGRLAILITYLSETQFTYSVLRDTQGNEILAFFTNQGYAAHDQQKGKLRLSLDLCKGSVFDEKGQRQKFWNWWDHGAHVHTPPFQPVRLQLNVYIQVKIKAQDQVFLTFAKAHDCLRLNVGARLRLKDSRMLWVLQRCGTTEDLVSPALLQKISSILTRVKKLLKKLDSDPSKAAADLHLISKVYRRMQGQHRKIQPKERN